MKSAIAFAFVLIVTFVGLTFGWVSAARAETLTFEPLVVTATTPDALTIDIGDAVCEVRNEGQNVVCVEKEDSCDVSEWNCVDMPLENGRVGETVRVCDVRVACTEVSHVRR